MEPTQEFLDGLAALRLELDAATLEKLQAFVRLLLATNEKFNLTSVTEPRLVWMRHILDSLSLVAELRACGATTVVDVGSGGGLPGIPLAVVMPKARFTLVEPTGKKAKFLVEAAESLGLKNVKVANDRAEKLAAPGSALRDAFDAVMARALGRLPVLLELTIPFARVGGLLLAIKGDQAPAEIEEARGAFELLHAKLVSTTRTSTGTIVRVRKLAPTPPRYPRRSGEPKRAPLK